MNELTSAGLLAGFIAGSALFSGTESAFTSLSPAQIADIRERYGRRGRLVASLSARPDRLLSTVLIGNNLMNVAASALATQITVSLFGNAYIGAMTGILTLVMLIFAEVTPKQVAIVNNEFICVHTARLIQLMSYVLSPVVWLVSSISRAVAKASTRGDREPVTMDSILHLVRQAESLGILEAYKSRVVKNLFRFNETPIDAVMTHRTEVFSLEQSTTLADAALQVAERGFARVPVYRDDPEQIVGVALAKDLMKIASDDTRALKDIMLPPIYVPEHRKIDRVMNRLLREKLNMAIVLDEYGGLAGVVTLEDILEEIIGEIYDEREERETTSIRRLGPTSYAIRADVALSHVNEFLTVQLSDEQSDVHTLGGYLTAQLGRVPQLHERIPTAAGVFTVTRARRTHLIELQYQPAPPSETSN